MFGLGKKTSLAVRLALAGALATIAALDAAHGRGARILGVHVLPPDALALAEPETCEGVAPTHVKPIDLDGPRPAHRPHGCE